MFTKEVPQDQWVAFFEHFRRLHKQTPVIIEMLVGSVLQTIVRNLPLRDITADLRDDRQHMVAVSAGEEAGHNMTHMISAPARVELQTTETGVHQALRIESSAGETTLLRFQPTPQPDAEWREEFSEEQSAVST